MTRKLFTDIAATYDRMNHLLSFGLDLLWRKAALQQVTTSPSRILDLACGTGDFTLALAERFPKAEILGGDLTPAMLEIARKKCTFHNVRFCECNAENLSNFSPLTFDLVTCAFGFRNFPDKSAALREIRRVLRNGGELIVLEFFRPKGRLAVFSTTTWVKALASLFSRDHKSAYAYLSHSIGHTLTADEFVRMAKDHGFAVVSRRTFPPCCTCIDLQVLNSGQVEQRHD